MTDGSCCSTSQWNTDLERELVSLKEQPIELREGFLKYSVFSSLSPKGPNLEKKISRLKTSISLEIQESPRQTKPKTGPKR